MSCASSRMSPTWRVPSIRSFMRLRQRRNVVLPQPDGPIRAVTARSGIAMEMSQSACLSPYQNDSPWTLNFGRASVTLGDLRPFSLRSEMIAEYDSVDTEAPSGFGRAPSSGGGGGIQASDRALAALI